MPHSEFSAECALLNSVESDIPLDIFEKENLCPTTALYKCCHATAEKSESSCMNRMKKKSNARHMDNIFLLKDLTVDVSFFDREEHQDPSPITLCDCSVTINRLENDPNLVQYADCWQSSRSSESDFYDVKLKKECKVVLERIEVDRLPVDKCDSDGDAAPDGDDAATDDDDAFPFPIDRDLIRQQERVSVDLKCKDDYLSLLNLRKTTKSLFTPNDGPLSAPPRRVPKRREKSLKRRLFRRRGGGGARVASRRRRKRTAFYSAADSDNHCNAKNGRFRNILNLIRKYGNGSIDYEKTRPKLASEMARRLMPNCDRLLLAARRRRGYRPGDAILSIDRDDDVSSIDDASDVAMTSSDKRRDVTTVVASSSSPSPHAYCFLCGASDRSVDLPPFFDHCDVDSASWLYLCATCSAPYSLWTLQPWKWTTFFCRSSRGRACGFVERNECQKCWFWHCVNFVKNHLALCRADDDSYAKYCDACDDETMYINESDNNSVATSDDSCRKMSDAPPLPPPPKFGKMPSGSDGRVMEYGALFGSTKGVRYVSRQPCIVLGDVDSNNVYRREILRLSALPLSVKLRLLKSYAIEDDDHQPEASESVPVLDNEIELDLSDQLLDIKNVEKSNNTKKRRRRRCGECVPCLTPDCGKCVYCLDQACNGGPGILKQVCKHRRCINIRRIRPSARRTSLVN